MNRVHALLDAEIDKNVRLAMVKWDIVASKQENRGLDIKSLKLQMG